VLNKIDLAPDPSFTTKDERIAGVFRLSCATGEGLDAFRRALFTLVPAPEEAPRAPDELPEFLVYRPVPKARPWSIFRTERGFRVVGTPPGEEELERALRAAGAKRGAEVEIGDETMELA
jgi:hypothetical protein